MALYLEVSGLSQEDQDGRHQEGLPRPFGVLDQEATEAVCRVPPDGAGLQLVVHEAQLQAAHRGRDQVVRNCHLCPDRLDRPDRR